MQNATDADIVRYANGDIVLDGRHKRTVLEFWISNLELDEHQSVDAWSSLLLTRSKYFCDLWNLAEKLGDPKTQRSILFSLIQFSASPDRNQGHELLTWKLMGPMGELPKSSGLRRWFVNFVAASFKPSTKTKPEIEPSLLLELFTASMVNRWASRKPKVPQLDEIDHYWKAGI
jgi:hypothetical protein